MYDIAAVYDQNLIGITDSFQTVSNHNNSFILCQFLNRGLQTILVFRVNICGGLVKDDDGSILQHSPGDRKALFFAAGERSASLTDHRVIAIGQSGDKFITASLFRRRNDFLMGSIRFAELNVVLNGIRKQIDILEYHTDIGHQLRQRICLYVFTADRNTAAVHIPKAGDQVTERCLAGTGGTDNRGHGTIRYFEADSIQNGTLFVGEAHILKFNAIGRRRGVNAAFAHNRNMIQLVDPVNGYLRQPQRCHTASGTL